MIDAVLGLPASKRINISTVLAGQRLGVKEVDEGIWLASFMGRFLAKAAEGLPPAGRCLNLAILERGALCKIDHAGDNISEIGISILSRGAWRRLAVANAD